MSQYAKVCSHCKNKKSANQFHKQTASVDGLQRTCKTCTSVLNRKSHLSRKPEAKRRLKDLVVTTDGSIVFLKTKQTARSTMLMHVHGISEDNFNYLLEMQGGKCDICGTSDPIRCFCVDHCHNTGRIRGILCDLCNKGLGAFKDNKNALARAIEYLNPNDPNIKVLHE